MTNKQIQLLKQWRDWHWQSAIWCKDNGFDYASELNENVARAYNAAITILKSDKNIIPIAREELYDYQQYKYGEWQE